MCGYLSAPTVEVRHCHSLQNQSVQALYTSGFSPLAAISDLQQLLRVTFLGWVSEGSPLVAPCSLSLLFRAAGVHVPLSWLPAQQASGGRRHCQFSSTPCLPRLSVCLSLSTLSSLPSRPFPLWHIWKLQLIIVCGLVSVFCFKKTPKVNIFSFALLSFPSPLELLP